MKLSIIIPCKNEENNIKDLNELLKESLNNILYEAIYIDDGSTDKTLEVLKSISKKDKSVKVLSFSRNFKKESAMLAGLENACGEYTCIIDGDLQQNPNYLLEMIAFLDKQSEYDEVAMVMKKRSQDSGIMSFCKKMFYKIIDSLSDIHFEEGASDFRMFRSNVKNAILNLKEKNRFSKGIFSWVGFKIKYLEYEVEPRKSGKSSFDFKTSLSYAFDGIISFSTKLLKFANVIGFITLLIAFIYLIVTIILNTFNIIIFLILLMSGINFILVGIMSMYISNIQIEVKNRPSYIIKERIGFGDKNE